MQRTSGQPSTYNIVMDKEQLLKYGCVPLRPCMLSPYTHPVSLPFCKQMLLMYQLCYLRTVADKLNQLQSPFFFICFCCMLLKKVGGHWGNDKNNCRPCECLMHSCTFPISSCSLYPLQPSLHPTTPPLYPVYRLPGTDKVSWQGVRVLSFTSLSGSRKLCSCHVAETIGQGEEAIGIYKKKMQMRNTTNGRPKP